MTPTVAAVIPTIPPRTHYLNRAVSSVKAQTRPADQIVVRQDVDVIGAAQNRNKALAEVECEWTAFLDDDDMWHPWHLDHLLAHAESTGADLVYPWFDGINTNIFDQIFGTDTHPVSPYQHPFGADQVVTMRTRGNWIPVTVLVRTELIKAVGGFEPPPWANPDGSNPCEDWGCWLKLLDAGARFAHLPEVTWRWMGHARHTSGRLWTDVYNPAIAPGPQPNRIHVPTA